MFLCHLCTGYDAGSPLWSRIKNLWISLHVCTSWFRRGLSKDPPTLDILFILLDIVLFPFLKICPDDTTFNFKLIKVRFLVLVNKTDNFKQLSWRGWGYNIHQTHQCSRKILEGEKFQLQAVIQSLNRPKQEDINTWEVIYLWLVIWDFVYFLHESVQCQDRAVYCSLQAPEKVTFLLHLKFIDNTNSASYYISETDE